MKKINKLLAVTIAAFFTAIMPTFASEMTFKEFTDFVEAQNPNADYIYVIGKYAFTSKIELNTQDVMLAAKSINTADKEGAVRNTAAYDAMTIHQIEANIDDNGDISSWTVLDKNLVGTTKLETTQTIDIDYIDYEKVMFKPTVTVDGLGEETVGAEKEYSIKTTLRNNDYANTMVKAYYKIVDADGNDAKDAVKSLTYYETGGAGQGNWLPLKFDKPFGPDEGFPLVNDATSQFKITFKKAGTYKMIVEFKTVADETVVATLEKEIIVKGIDVEPKINEAVNGLKQDAADNGFKEIKYENKTLTFEIDEDSLENTLYAYASGSDIISLFQAFLNSEAGAVSAKVAGIAEPFELSSNMSEHEIKVMAAVVLAKMAGNNLTADQVDELKQMTYQDVAGKSITITVTYEGATEKEVEYTLAFTYDIKTYKDEAVESAVTDLQGTFKEHTEYGISDVTYEKEKETVTFKVSDPNVLLTKFEEDTTGIIAIFRSNLTDAVSFKIKGLEETIPITEVNDTNIKLWAAMALASMVDGVSADQANTLKLSDVVGKSATAEITYFDGTKVEYTVAFADDYEAEKDNAIYNAATEVNKTASTYGFTSIAYEKENNTLTFSIDQTQASTKKLNEFATAEILKLFKENLKGAKSFKINGDNQEDTTIPENLSDSNIKDFAIQVFTYMLKDSGEEVTKKKPSEWTLDLVKGKEASAIITFADGTNATYTVKFQ